jgi:protein subunit release factor A
MKKELLFSVTKDDLRVDTFRAGGPGGQNQNKRETGVRITHPASGAVTTSREHRTQEQNKAAAFRRLIDHPKFRSWHRREVARRSLTVQSVDDQLTPKNIKIEIRQEGRWVPAEGDLTSPTEA